MWIVSRDPDTGRIAVLASAFVAVKEGGAWRIGYPSAEDTFKHFERVGTSEAPEAVAVKFYDEASAAVASILSLRNTAPKAS